MSNHRWTYADDLVFAEMWGEGASSKSIAAYFGISECAAKLHRIKMNLPARIKRAKVQTKIATVKRSRLRNPAARQLFDARGGNFDSSKAAYLLAELWRRNEKVA